MTKTKYEIRVDLDQIERIWEYIPAVTLYVYDNHIWAGKPCMVGPNHKIGLLSLTDLQITYLQDHGLLGSYINRT